MKKIIGGLLVCTLLLSGLNLFAQTVVKTGENLSKKGDVVVVSINHRLNILGFLDLSAYGEKYKHSANNSILDMVAALEWVKTNISNFGGDPNNVMIFGQSGGGAKVNTLLAMPKAKGCSTKRSTKAALSVPRCWKNPRHRPLAQRLWRNSV